MGDYLKKGKGAGGSYFNGIHGFIPLVINALKLL
jgi:hypothetical protein